jgi:hypothetical protein
MWLQQKQAEKANFHVTGSIAHVADICDIMIYLLKNNINIAL